MRNVLLNNFFWLLYAPVKHWGKATGGINEATLLQFCFSYRITSKWRTITSRSTSFFDVLYHIELSKNIPVLHLTQKMISVSFTTLPWWFSANPKTFSHNVSKKIFPNNFFVCLLNTYKTFIKSKRYLILIFVGLLIKNNKFLKWAKSVVSE